MARSARQVDEEFARIKREFEGNESLRSRLAARPPPGRMPNSARVDRAHRDRRWAQMAAPETVRRGLHDLLPEARAEAYAGNIENLIGEITLPVGVAGPLRMLGTSFCDDVWVPLATSEGALVASYNRGCQAISEAGGCRSAVLSEGICRAPAFVFRDFETIGRFCQWLLGEREHFPALVREVSRHTRFHGLNITVEGNHLYLLLEFTTGEAAGQNMVTLASQRICEHLVEHAPVRPEAWFVESNLSGDKKASMQSFESVRGKKATAEVLLPPDVIGRILRTTPEMMETYWRVSAMGGVMSGTIGVQGHFANGLAALFLATGQDAACVAEASIGVTRMEHRGADGLYAAVTLPNLVVGTVGGGTRLPAQRAALDLMGLAGDGSARRLAEIAAGLCLAGELSIIAALSAGHFAAAHRKWGRPPGGRADNSCAHDGTQ